MTIAVGPDVIEDGLVLYLDASDSSSYPRSGTSWYDFLNTSNSGALQTGSDFSSVNKGAITFNGTSGYVSYGNKALNTNTITISFWVLFDVLASGSYYSIFSFGGFISQGFVFQRSGASNKFRFAWNGTDYYDSASFTETGTWNHISVVVNSGVPEYLYINGQQYGFTRSYGSSSFSINSTKTIEIGRRTDTVNQYVNGKIASVSLYNRALSENEIIRNYRSTMGKFFIPSDPDARNYVSRVEAADGQSLEPGVVAAIDEFIHGCKTDDAWDFIVSSCILCGARTLAGALVPLVGNNITNQGVQESYYNRITGMTATGSYLDTNTPDVSSDVPLNDVHMYVRISSLPTALNTGFLVSGNISETGNSSLMLQQYNNQFFIYNRGRTNEYISLGSKATGDFALWRSNQYNAINAVNSTISTNGRGSNASLGNNVKVSPSDGRIQFFSFGRSFSTNARYNAFRARVANLINSISDTLT